MRKISAFLLKSRLFLENFFLKKFSVLSIIMRLTVLLLLPAVLLCGLSLGSSQAEVYPDASIAGDVAFLIVSGQPDYVLYDDYDEIDESIAFGYYTSASWTNANSTLYYNLSDFTPAINVNYDWSPNDSLGLYALLQDLMSKGLSVFNPYNVTVVPILATSSFDVSLPERLDKCYLYENENDDSNVNSFSTMRYSGSIGSRTFWNVFDTDGNDWFINDVSELSSYIHDVIMQYIEPVNAFTHIPYFSSQYRGSSWSITDTVQEELTPSEAAGINDMLAYPTPPPNDQRRFLNTDAPIYLADFVGALIPAYFLYPLLGFLAFLFVMSLLAIIKHV